ncbi:FAD-binding oxidoreductase [Aspergillus glaucus CBS 516.65]|uniref:FAD-binding PCMH-type domain-containing protein n=1 Tax=Aspergillus glaucus CBS 516.65 TaxID=1160497 RepID=A0A1L9V545_ASPGL|nr:hypothetical protein ASPGLDRAFT_137911 [Aspergillus glaucus CBS 516.65]OJJ78979.1 hypothetical protein ASPGLDRAFT_137911 [Aspergillus glaucus CBS 516.65]
MTSSFDSTTLQSLKDALTSSLIFTPDSEGYQDSLRRWSDTGVKPAGIVVMPSKVADVQTALLWAQKHHVDLAIKGGGHSVAGTSSSQDGLVIDLSHLKAVSVDTAAKTVTVQGGATWKEVDEAAWEHGLAAVGGTVNHTGVGGLTLGGGYGWLSGLYGLTIDNLLSARVVLADGRLVTASESENPDLLWGLKGAGYNFGVVVEFTYRAHEQKNHVFAGIISFLPDKLEAVVEQLNETLLNPDPRGGVMCFLAQPPGAPVPMTNVLCYYNGTKEEGEKRYCGLLELGPVVNTLDMIPYSLLNSLQNPMATYGGRKSFKGIFYQPPMDPQFVRTILTDLTAKIQEDEDLKASALILEFFDMRKICEVPSTATAFASRNSTQNGIICLRWSDSSKDAQNRAWAREMQARWKEQLNTPDTDVPQYINYAEPGDSAVSNIYGANLGRLQEIKAKYDPTNVFHKMHPIE